MNTTNRLLTTFAYALLGFVLGLLVGFIVLVLTTNHYSSLLLIGAITAAVFAVIRFLVAPYTGTTTRATNSTGRQDWEQDWHQAWHQDGGPSVNVDGTPMNGNVDINGNSFGVTSSNHHLGSNDIL